MNEENKPLTGKNADSSQPDKLPKSKRTALVRYLAILFAFAFAIVLLSLFLQYRRNASKKISDLTSMSNSAVANASQLQEENRALEETVEKLEAEAAETQEAHEKELEDERRVYDALVRLLSDFEIFEKTDGQEPSEDPKAGEDFKIVQEGQDKLSESAKEAFAAYTEKLENMKTEETKDD